MHWQFDHSFGSFDHDWQSAGSHYMQHHTCCHRAGSLAASRGQVRKFPVQKDSCPSDLHYKSRANAQALPATGGQSALCDKPTPRPLPRSIRGRTLTAGQAS